MDKMDAMDMMDPVDPVDSMDSMDSMDPMDPMDSMDKTRPDKSISTAVFRLVILRLVILSEAKDLAPRRNERRPFASLRVTNCAGKPLAGRR
ncbi:hypothetical protein K8I61_18710 [bacterium]|nr:hypothetical protein [bacterium]